jgi:hypothetical protein
MVNINTVYDAVLVITNKDNRGYITPEEFNSLAIQSQEAIFASYFLREMTYEMQGSGSNVQSDFSNPTLTIAQKISAFYKEETLTKSDKIFTYPVDFYKLGIVSVNNIGADYSSHGNIKYINKSPLTYPVLTQPVYTLEKTGVRVYPDTITTGVAIDYLSKPIKPKWGYIMPTAAQIASGVPNKPIYDPTQFDPASDSYSDTAKSYNFDLDPSEQTELIIRILTYAGVVIKQGDVTAFAQGKEQELQTTEQ